MDFKSIFDKIADDYESLLESGNMSDVTLVAGDKELKLHKVILSSRSPVFDAMFSHDSTEEAQENRVEITDVDLEVLELLVRYIYTGKVKMLKEYAVDLLFAAEKYQLKCLKSVCEQQLMSQISTESVSDLLIFADNYQVTELYRKCRDYIINNGTKVVASEGWNKVVLKVDLLAKLYEHLYFEYSKEVNDYDKKIESKKSEANYGINCLFGLDLIFENSNVRVCNEEMSDVILVTAKPDCLKSICEQRLLSQVISSKSVSDLIIFADMNQDIELCYKCIDFIGFNLTQVIATVGWKKILVRADLLAKICKLLDLDFSELLLSPITINSVSNLSILADQPECRKLAFEQQLLSHISTESVSNLLIFADIHQLTQLFTRCLDYIIDNGTEVMASIGWEKILVRADLLAKIYEHLSLKYTRVMDDKRNAQSIHYNDYDFESEDQYFRDSDSNSDDSRLRQYDSDY